MNPPVVKNKSYKEQDMNIKYDLSTEEITFVEKERLLFYDQKSGTSLNRRPIQERLWHCGIYMGEFGSYFSPEFLERLAHLCKAKDIGKLFGIPNIRNASNEEELKKRQRAYKDYFDPPLICSFYTDYSTLIKIDDDCYSLLCIQIYLLFPSSQDFVILNNIEEDLQVVAGPRETVEYLIGTGCEESWQIIFEDWAYHYGYYFKDLRQLAKDLGYSNGDVSRPPSDAESS